MENIDVIQVSDKLKLDERFSSVCEWMEDLSKRIDRIEQVLKFKGLL